MTKKRTLQKASYATLISLLFLMVALVPQAAADGCHEGRDCEPVLDVTGFHFPEGWSPFEDDENVYSGWTVVDVVFPEGCDCFVEGVEIDYVVLEDFAPVGYSSGIETRQVDHDTWEVHALDFDLYEVYFTVFYYCENGESGKTTTTWLQRN